MLFAQKSFVNAFLCAALQSVVVLHGPFLHCIHKHFVVL